MHPTPDELSKLVFGKLDEEGADVVFDHVEQCRECEETLHAMETASDDIVHMLRGTTIKGKYTQEPDCEKLVSVIKAIGRKPTLVGKRPPTAQPQDDEDLGTIRDYQLLAKLGEGGMGTVYKALHTRLDKVVALKVLPARRMKDQHAVRRFHREMKAVGRLAHPNIVAAHDAGDFEGTHFLVMELIAGIDLSSLVRRLGPAVNPSSPRGETRDADGMTVADACELIRQAALGLAHVHQHGLVHRDIKPSNLMLAASGQPTATSTNWFSGRNR